VPSLEVGVPIEFFAFEARFEIHPRLMHVRPQSAEFLQIKQKKPTPNEKFSLEIFSGQQLSA
jgi:hypothetical protein